MAADRNLAGDGEADLVVVSSPLQYMNAVEQRGAAGGAPADLVLIGDRHGGVTAIEALMARRSPWQTVYRHGRRPRPHRNLPAIVKDALDAAHRASLGRLARRLAGERYRDIVIGDYRNVSQRVLAASVRSEGFVLLDDGSVTPQAAAFRARPATAPEPRQFDLHWFRTGLARTVLGDGPTPEPAACRFFTIYGRLIADRLKAGDMLEDNRYALWLSNGAQAFRGSAIWLLGADHAEAGICGMESYRRLILDGVGALKAAGAGEIVYRPHRGEADGKIEALAREAGLTLRRSPTPVELDYLEAAERPATVAVVASSAADTLAVIDPALDIVRLAMPDDYLVRRRDHIRAVVAAHHLFNPRLRTIGARDGVREEGSR